ncbi:EFR1 family ferrodoxin [Agathobaculum sp.]|uniref:EFR1 family ferrodoxin n=1 Tax=Agathobaculum sp. TaxID=2048138 RepID=UPI002A80C895|nr:EFR1 family ferrodoxin [Agathobaculum sp.]MDY3618254.1 EFR1 family ferrodoxin [Agathobaculum sp.]
MTGIYFSGTGNTRWCMRQLLEGLGEDEGALCPLEAAATAGRLREAEEIVFGYPVYYSNLPKIVRDFIEQNAALWQGKKVFVLATMGMFSGDGAGLAARLLKKHGAEITGGLHVQMPDCIADVKALKKPLEQNRRIVEDAKGKLRGAAEQMKNGKPPRAGLSFGSHLAGLFGQRLYFSQKTAAYTDKLKIDSRKCVGCGLCAGLCPMQNLTIEQGKAAAHGSCTMCYRCVCRCPQQAITLLGKEIVEQSVIEKYI